MKKLGGLSFTYILGILAVIYFSCLTGLATYRNYKTNQQIKTLKAEIELKEQENQNLKNLIAYYQTQSFKEKEARKKLGLVKPDEKMIIISQEPPSSKKSPAPQPEGPKKPNYLLWWEFFFK